MLGFNVIPTGYVSTPIPDYSDVGADDVDGEVCFDDSFSVEDISEIFDMLLLILLLEILTIFDTKLLLIFVSFSASN